MVQQKVQRLFILLQSLEQGGGGQEFIDQTCQGRGRNRLSLKLLHEGWISQGDAKFRHHRFNGSPGQSQGSRQIERYEGTGVKFCQFLPQRLLIRFDPGRDIQWRCRIELRLQSVERLFRGRLYNTIIGGDDSSGLIFGDIIKPGEERISKIETAVLLNLTDDPRDRKSVV